jgi:manganese/zinc/iron transport system permease protein
MLSALGELWQQLLLPLRELPLLFVGRAHNSTVVMLSAAMLGVACGLVGTFALLRKRALVADALSHATLPGICLVFLLADAWGGPARSVALLLVGAAASGALGIGCVQQITSRTRLGDDVAIGLVLSIFFGVGIVLLDLASRISRTPAGGLHHLIYGQAAAMTGADALTMGIVLLIATISCLSLFKEFTLICFNEPFAHATGWPVARIEFAMMALVVLVTVAGLQAVGLILVVAMLIIPPVTARLWTDRLRPMALLACMFGGVSAYVGVAVSAAIPRSPAGAVIVLTAGSIFVVSLLVAPARGLLPEAMRRARQRIQFSIDHALESMVEALPTMPKYAVRWVLLRGGYARVSGSAIVLTPKGSERGERVARNHRLWEQYLITHADVAPSHVDWSVDQVEHILSREMIEELEAALAEGEARA